jgi:hypothetical protein
LAPCVERCARLGEKRGSSQSEVHRVPLSPSCLCVRACVCKSSVCVCRSSACAKSTSLLQICRQAEKSGSCARAGHTPRRRSTRCRSGTRFQAAEHPPFPRCCASVWALRRDYCTLALPAHAPWHDSPAWLSLAGREACPLRAWAVIISTHSCIARSSQLQAAFGFPAPTRPSMCWVDAMLGAGVPRVMVLLLLLLAFTDNVHQGQACEPCMFADKSVLALVFTYTCTYAAHVWRCPNMAFSVRFVLWKCT